MSATPEKVRKRKFSAKVQFTHEEDTKLIRLVQLFGSGQWRSVAAAMTGRNARQCRDRYNNYVSPNLRTGNWTTAEDQQLRQLVNSRGPAWSGISKTMSGRSINALRSRYFEITRDPTKDGNAARQSEKGARYEDVKVDPLRERDSEERSDGDVDRAFESAFDGLTDELYEQYCRSRR